MLIKFVRKSFMNQRKAMLIMIAAVAIGTALASSLISISLEIGDKVSRELRSFGANILIEPRIEGLADISGQKRYLRENDIKKVKTIFWRHNILGAAPFLDEAVNIEFGGTSRSVNVSGTWYENEIAVPGESTKFIAGVRDVFPWWSIEGRWPSGTGEVMVGRNAAGNMGITTGQAVLLEGREFTLTGIFESGTDEDSSFIMDMEALQSLTGSDGKVSRVFVSALTKPMDDFAYRDPEGMTQAEYEKWYCTGYVTSIAKQLEEVFAGSRAKPVWKVAAAEGRILERLTLLIYILTIIVLIAAALGVSTAMIMSHLRRVEEVGLMKVLGADKLNILTLFLMEGLFIGLIGGLIGYVLSIGTADFIGEAVFNTGFEKRALLFVLSLVSAVVISLGGIIIPVRKALNIEPGVVLKGAE